jgi:hypothetical protein
MSLDDTSIQPDALSDAMPFSPLGWTSLADKLSLMINACLI